jgi:hypothetical protein
VSRRDEIWRSFLGDRDPTADEAHDIMLLAERLSLGDSDPFWGIVAFMYTRLAGMAAAHEQLSRTLADRIASKIDRLSALPDSTLTSVRAALAEWRPKFEPPTQLSFRAWLREHSRSVLYFSGLTGGAVVLLLMAAFWLGAHQSAYFHDTPMVAQTHPTENWENTKIGRKVHAWAQLNGAGLDTVLQCNFGKSAKVIHSNGLTICYPSGSGNGYYLPGP